MGSIEWSAGPDSPLALLDHWLDERAFTHRKQVELDPIDWYGGKGNPLIQIFRPHGNEWLFTLAQGKKDNILKIKLWGPGMLLQEMVGEYNLASPTSFDEITSAISAWRKVKYAAFKEVWRYIKIIEHRTAVRPTTNCEHWVVSMAADYFKLTDLHDDYKRVVAAVQSIGVDLNVPEKP